jgi:class 3 adenylate cyclase
MVKRMQITTQPIIEKCGGQVVKFEADNCFAMFDEVAGAARAAIDLNTAFGAMNQFTDDEFDIRVSIGIDYGDVLLIGGPDYFGHTVNRASKLGEDVAGPGEIIVTEEAFNQIPKTHGISGKPITFTISGIELKAVTLTY